MNKTKKKTILAAVSLFNECGLTNVRNQDIAKAADISLSNFNCHFKTKQDLVFAVFEYMNELLQEKVYGNMLLIQEGQGLEITKSYFEFEETFRFFYLDSYNILNTYPELNTGVRQRIKEAIQIIKNLHYLAIGMDYMKPEPADMPGLYDYLARQIWINNHFWFAQATIRDTEGNRILKGLEACFAISYPYLTKKGAGMYRALIKRVTKEYEAEVN